jgi:hypothetical protein
MFWQRAGVAELADAPDSKSGARKGVEVQVLSPVLTDLKMLTQAIFGRSHGAL